MEVARIDRKSFLAGILFCFALRGVRYFRRHGLLYGIQGLVLRVLKIVPGGHKVIQLELDKSRKTFYAMREEMAEKRVESERAVTKRLPPKGIKHEDIIARLTELRKTDIPFKDGKVFGYFYFSDEGRTELMNKAYCLYSHTNLLQPTFQPSCHKFESEIVGMAGLMLGGEEGHVCGNITSGGTESIMMAIKAARERARDLLPDIKTPEIIACRTAHPAAAKAAHYLGFKFVLVPFDKDFKISVDAVRKAINKNTVLIYASAPSFPQGIIDPIEELGQIAQQNGVLLHVDMCLGGFVLPWMVRLGYKLPKFDFAVPGVTSISADCHKYGQGAKGTSLVLFRERSLRKYMFFVFTEFSGGLYGTATLAGTRPGGLLAASWAAMQSLGEEGYIEATRAMVTTARRLMDGIKKVPGCYILGDPQTVGFAIGHKSLDVYMICDALQEMGWILDRNGSPNSIHMSVTNCHVGMEDKFLKDFAAAVEDVRTNPQKYQTDKATAPVYGAAAGLPDRDLLKSTVKDFLDVMWE